jgi:hypothetical protein
MIIQFLTFLLLIYDISFNNLHMLNHSCIPGVKPTTSWCIIYLIRFASILLRIFASNFIKENGL